MRNKYAHLSSLILKIEKKSIRGLTFLYAAVKMVLFLENFRKNDFGFEKDFCKTFLRLRVVCGIFK